MTIMVDCEPCEGTGNLAPGTRDPQDQLYWECGECNGAGTVPAKCEDCGEALATETNAHGDILCVACNAADDAEVATTAEGDELTVNPECIACHCEVAS